VSGTLQIVELAGKVQNFYNTSLGIGAILAFGIIVFAGVLYATGGAIPDNISNAKKWIWAALLGLLLLFGSFVLLRFIGPNLTDLANIGFPCNEAADDSTVSIPDPPDFGDIGTLPGGKLDLSTLPTDGSGRGAIVLCGDNNPCTSGTYLIADVSGGGSYTVTDLELLKGNVIRGDQASYVIVAGDISNAVLYENVDYNGSVFGVRVIINKNSSGSVVCTSEYKFGEPVPDGTIWGPGPTREVRTNNCTSDQENLGGGLVGISLHDFCIVDDDGDGSCSNTWGDDVSSMTARGR